MLIAKLENLLELIPGTAVTLQSLRLFYFHFFRACFDNIQSPIIGFILLFRIHPGALFWPHDNHTCRALLHQAV